MGPARGHKDFLPVGWTSAVTQRLVLDVEKIHPRPAGAAAGGPAEDGDEYVRPSSAPPPLSVCQYKHPSVPLSGGHRGGGGGGGIFEVRPRSRSTGPQRVRVFRESMDTAAFYTL